MLIKVIVSIDRLPQGMSQVHSYSCYVVAPYLALWKNYCTYTYAMHLLPDPPISSQLVHKGLPCKYTFTIVKEALQVVAHEQPHTTIDCHKAATDNSAAQQYARHCFAGIRCCSLGGTYLGTPHNT